MPLRAAENTLGAPSTSDLRWARQESGGFEWDLWPVALPRRDQGRSYRRGRELWLASRPRLVLSRFLPRWVVITFEPNILEHPPQRQIRNQLEPHIPRSTSDEAAADFNLNGQSLGVPQSVSGPRRGVRSRRWKVSRGSRAAWLDFGWLD